MVLSYKSRRSLQLPVAASRHREAPLENRRGSMSFQRVAAQLPSRAMPSRSLGAWQERA